MGDLFLLPPVTELRIAFGSRERIDEVIATVRARAVAHEPDLTTAKGRTEVASVAYQVTRSKTALLDVGKEIAAELRQAVKDVGAECEYIRDVLDTLRDQVRAPLTEWESVEQTRKDAITARIEAMTDHPAMKVPDDLRARIAAVEAVDLDETFQEFIGEAALAKDAALRGLRMELDAMLYREMKAREERAAAEAAEAERAARAKALAEAREAERAARAKEEAERVAAAQVGRKVEPSPEAGQEAAATAAPEPSPEVVFVGVDFGREPEGQDRDSFVIETIARAMVDLGASRDLSVTIATAIFEGHVPFVRVEADHG